MSAKKSSGGVIVCSALSFALCLSMFGCKEAANAPVTISSERAQQLTVENFNTVFCQPSQSADGQIRAAFSKISAKNLRVEKETEKTWSLIHEDLSGTYLRARVDKHSGIVGYVEVRSVIE